MRDNSEGRQKAKRERSSSLSRSRSRSRSRSPRRIRVRSKRVVIANIPYDVSWQKLKELFREKIGYTGFLKLFKTNGKPNGMGLMEFRTYDGAEKAIELMHRFEIGDRKLVVREETHRDIERMAEMESDAPGDQLHPNIPNPISTNSVSVNNPALAAIGSVTPVMLERMGIEGPITDSIYVSNLDYKVTWQKLKDVFKLAGRVMNATIKEDADKKSRGFGVVKFEYPYEAVQAITMFNGQQLNGRTMRVKIDREGNPAPPYMPLFPPTPGGMAASAAFLGMVTSKASSATGPGGFNSNALSGAPSNRPGIGGNVGTSVMPQQSAAAAAAIADLLGGGAVSGGPGVPGGPSSGPGICRTGAADLLAAMSGANATPVSGGGRELMMMNLMQQQQQMAPAGGIGPLASLRGFNGGNTDSSMDGGMSRFGSGIAGAVNNTLLGGGISGLGAPSGLSQANSGLQQLIMAAAAGGMAPEQLEKITAQLGINGAAVSMNGSNMGEMLGGRGNYDSGFVGSRDDDMRRIDDRRPRDRYDDRPGLRGYEGMGGAEILGCDPGNMYGGGGVGIINGLSSIGVGGAAAGVVKNGCSLVVKNLPFSYTWQDLKRSFREFGDVRYADIASDAQGKSRGHGTVRYSNTDDAARAIARMHGANFDGRRIRVEYE